MRLKRWMGLGLAVALAACGMPVQPPAPTAPPDRVAFEALADGQVYPDGNHYRLLALEELPIVGVSADSAAAGFAAGRGADGDLATQWMNGGYLNPTGWLAVALAKRATIGSVGIKTGPLPAGVRYDVQVSDDGTNWANVLTNQTNSTWNLETKALPAGTAGQRVRLFFRNNPSSPAAHFSVFELVVSGQAGPGPSPSPTATPTSAPSSTPTPQPTGTPGGEGQRQRPTSVSASSVYATLTPEAAVDGNVNTQWANGGYREAEAWLALSFANRLDFRSVRIKTGALPAGVSYQLEVSSDGTSWTAASQRYRNTTWELETVGLAGQGQYLRVHFFNNPASPIARFSVFEIEVFAAGAGGTNRQPVIDAVRQSPLKINLGESGTLTASAHDPDGDALSYSWQAQRGSIVGSGPSVTYRANFQTDSPYHVDDRVTLTVTDGKSAPVTRTFTVDNYVGTRVTLPANQAVQWDPAKAAFAQLFGTVTVNAAGDFSVYESVIAEYSTADGRQMALLKPGTTTLTGVTGNIFMYLLGPTGAVVPHPSITLTLSGGGQTVTRAITAANVAADYNQGYVPSLSPGAAGFFIGETTAKNGSSPYRTLLYLVGAGQYTAPSGEPPSGTISYRLVRTGDVVSGLDQRLCPYDCNARLMLTDSQGGLGDNTGAWTVYDMVGD